ncbi:MMPL family transporter [Dactylosporangium aurantiacum]|uniref:MMPL family transporter n=1 Tax=Dactylosporangium aurantiacum TaxID=35754 RepID=A0A9Q9IPV5_9ACTN|nr:MMPL family transporter [Dactylosporangium aurantiacum]MDG6103175.1 MMPL family transporter [Dactylosporangium aurantiacum]UWZ57682.1 MMPL family transporter [Dactylosporangium aurantiacum]
MLALLGRWTAGHRMFVLAGWVVIALAGAVFGGTVYDRTRSVDSLRPDAESAVAQARIDRLAPEGERVVAVIAGRDFNATALVDNASRVMFDIRAIPGVATVTDAYTAGSGQVAADNRSSLVTVELRPELSDAEALAVADRVAAALHRIDAPEVRVGGELLAERTFGEQAVRDAAVGEGVALVVLCGVLAVVLGGLLVGSLPLVTALGTVAATLLALTGLAAVVPVSEYAVNVVTLLGLGLAVDYSLLIVTRFREERAADREATVPDLLARTVATAGRAVLVSGLAVGAALAGLFAFAEPLLAAMALGGALVVCLATLAGLTLVPALVALTHRRIPAPRLRAARNGRGAAGGGLARLAGAAQRRPVLVAAAVTAGLAVLSLPLLGVTLANSDARSLPAGSEERLAYEAVERDFAKWTTQPVTVLIEANATDPPAAALLTRIRELTGEAELDVRTGLPPDVTVVDLRPAGPADGAPAQRLVRQLRALDAPVPLLVAGPAAELIDARSSVASRLPVAVAVIVAATALLLFALTGSVVVPVKALCMNVLTLLATLGVLVAVFQWGWGAALLGFQPWGALDLTTPLLLFVFIFGLSMDYEVFLLARIKEEWDRRTAQDRAANDRAVLTGIAATGPVVTTAALAVGIVFLGFALGDLVAVKEIGVGMTIAVLLDVTVVRGLLLPAVMSLLGAANWWRLGRRPAGHHGPGEPVRAGTAAR